MSVTTQPTDRVSLLNNAIDDVLRSRTRLDEAWANYKIAVDADLAARQELDGVSDVWQEAHDQAVYTAGFAFTVEGNRTFIEENGARRSLTADEREAWCERKAAADPEVARLHGELTIRRQTVERAKADLALAVTGLSVAKHLLGARQSILDAICDTAKEF